jgi:hypothetical protein
MDNYSLNMKFSFTSWGAVLTMFSVLTIVASVDALSHRAAHQKRGQVRNVKYVLPAGTGSNSFMNAVNDRSVQGMYLTLP